MQREGAVPQTRGQQLVCSGPSRTSAMPCPIWLSTVSFNVLRNKQSTFRSSVSRFDPEKEVGGTPNL